MNQLEAQYQEILHTLDKLLANLGLMLEDYDVEYLTQADLYIEIFKIMFPVLEPILNADFGEDVTDEELIQYLINILAKDIIKMDLGHIKGELIAQGDAKHILNFLQLLFEISNMVVEKDSDKKSKPSKRDKKKVKSSGNSADQTSNNSQRSSIEVKPKYNSVQGINAEFSNSSVSDESNANASHSERDSNAEEQHEVVVGNQAEIARNYNKSNLMKGIKTESRYDSQSVSRISEVSKSKESSEYDRGVKKPSQKIEEFNPAMLHVKSLVADGGKHGSYTLEANRRPQHKDEYDEEEESQQYEGEHGEYGEEEYEGEEYQEGEEGEELEDHHQYLKEEDYYKEEGEEIEQDEEGHSEEHVDGLEIYSNDPIDYRPINNKNMAERDETRGKGKHGNNNKKSKESSKNREQQEYEELEEMEHGEEMQHEGYEEHEGQEYYEEEEEYDEYDDQAMEREREAQIQMQMQQRHMGYEGMEEVVEEDHDEETHEDEENYGDRANQVRYPQEAYEQAGHGKPTKKAKKSKGKTKKASSKTKSSKAVVVDYPKLKVEYRPLRPATAGMKRPQTATSKRPGTANMKNERNNKEQSKKSKGKKTLQQGELTESKKQMVHSKSERHLYVSDEQEEHSQSQQSGAYEDNSEDRGMEPKRYSQNGESQIPSQNGHANEQSDAHQEHEEEGIHEEHEGQEDYEQQYYHDEEAQQIANGNVFKILSDNVKRVKENLRENRAIEDIPFDDHNTVKMIRQQKEQYKSYLNEFIKDHQIREKKFKNLHELKQKNFLRKQRSERIRNENIRKEFENQQKSLYYKMRDEKVNYLRRIHKTIFELEKKRIIEDKKEYMQFRRSKNEETCHIIDSIKNEYRNRLEILRESNSNQQYERKVASEAQKAFLQTLERELRLDQLKEVERLKNKWRMERERFSLMIQDEGFLEQKVMQLYKKGAI